MENYTKGENIVTEAEWNIPGCSNATTKLEIAPSTKVRDVITVALEKLKNENQLLFIGAGPAVVKVVSMVEIVKKRVKKLHQITHLGYKRVDEYWEPKLEGLDRLKVTREVPAVAVLLSKEPLDSSVPGYQAPGSTGEELWLSDAQVKKKKSNNSKTNKKRNFERSGTNSDTRNQNWQQGAKDESGGRHYQKRNNNENKAHKGNQNNKNEKDVKLTAGVTSPFTPDNKEE